jgi:protein-disulfide isomerase
MRIWPLTRRFNWRSALDRHVGQARAQFELGVTVLMAAIAVLLLAFVAHSYLRKPGYVTTAPPVPLEPVSLRGAMVAGCDSASVAIIEYMDYECPACTHFARTVLPSIRHQYIDTCKAVLALKHFPVAAAHASAVNAARAAACAGRDGRFWAMDDLLWQDQDRLDHAGLTEKAKRIGLDAPGFEACLNSGVVLSQIRTDAGEGLTLGVYGTPTLFIGVFERSDAVRVVRRVEGGSTTSQLEDILDGLLRVTAR